MNTKRLAGVACLILATAAVLGMAHAQSLLEEELLWVDRDPARPVEAQPLAEETAREVLRDYFYQHYSEAACSAIYADLTHDGQPELLVLEMEADRTGEAISLHSDPVAADRFSAARVTVLRAGSDGGVLPIYQFDCGSAHTGWGQLYLRQWEDRAYLLKYTPYTANGRSDFRFSLFSLGESGAMRVEMGSAISFAAAASAAGADDASQAEIEAFAEEIAALLAEAKPVIVYDVVHDRTTGTDGPRQFAYLDELFTDFWGT